MAPVPALARIVLSLRRSSSSAANSSSIWEIVKRQWELPGEILSVLLLVGSDVVQTALAQLAGHLITPVAFSFGWLPYMMSATLGAAAGHSLMPEQPDYLVTIINVVNGYTRENQSWILGRVYRDFDHWRPRESIPPKIRDAGSREIQNTLRPKDTLRDAPLTVAVFDATEATGQLVLDWVWYTGFLAAPVQLGVAAIPGALHGNWAILLITGAGTLFAFIAGALPQWRREKWACQRNSRRNICLTQGNGSSLLLVIRGRGVGFDLEQMSVIKGKQLPFTVMAMSVLTVLWLALLITVAGLQEDTWYLLGIGMLGIVQTAVAGAAARTPQAYGIHLNFVEAIAKSKVMHTFMLAESNYPGVGLSVLDTFFPGGLHSYEADFWENARRTKFNRTSDDRPTPTLEVPIQVRESDERVEYVSSAELKSS